MNSAVLMKQLSAKRQLVKVLQEENEELLRRLRTLQQYERADVIERASIDALIRKLDGALRAVQVLADAVDYKTAVGRGARQEARQALETVKVLPPKALGYSRKPAAKKRRRKKRLTERPRSA